MAYKNNNQYNKKSMAFFVKEFLHAGLSSDVIKNISNDFPKFINIMENSPEKMLKVKGIGQSNYNKLLKNWNDKKHLIPLANLLGSFNLTPYFIERIYDEFKDKAIYELQKNPYILINMKNIGFKKADNIALSLGIKKDSEFRIEAFLNFQMEQNNNIGRSYITINEAMGYIESELGFKVTEDKVRNIVDNHSKNLVLYKDNYICFVWDRQYETEIFDYFKRNKNKKNNYNPQDIIKFIEEFEHKNNIKFSEQQKKAIHDGIMNKIHIITGYAGTGKTFVTRAILDFLSKEIGRDNIAGTALSGMAVRRSANVTGHNFKTIHSHLGYSGDKKGFKYNRQNPLSYRTIVLDEASMVNNYLFYSLYDAIREDTHLIMVGDDAQLPPIGAGNIFHDAIKLNMVSKTVLDRIFRTDNDINIMAGDVRQGQIPEKYYAKKQGWNFIGIKVSKDLSKDKQREESNKFILSRLFELVAKVDAEKRNKKQQGSIGEIEDIEYYQVLSAQKKGILGVDYLNKKIQKLVNNPDNKRWQDKLELNNKTYAVGDKIIHLINKNMLLPNGRYDRIFNGTLGIIKLINHQKRTVDVFTNTNQIIRYTFDEMKYLVDHAFAITVHKTQGSEFQTVFLPLSMSQFIMLNRRWLYTAITRAKSNLNIISEYKTFYVACKKEDSEKRKSLLSLKSSCNEADVIVF